MTPYRNKYKINHNALQQQSETKLEIGDETTRNNVSSTSKPRQQVVKTYDRKHMRCSMKQDRLLRTDTTD